MKESNLPDIIVLYGPPLSGKGTQGVVLEKRLTDFVHLDFGTKLREFVSKNLDSPDLELANRASRMNSSMSAGNAVLTQDLRFVVENFIQETVKNKQRLLIEGPGRLLEEAIWLSGYFAKNTLRVGIIHLHIDLDTTLLRAKSRWFCKGSRIPFASKEEAVASGLGEPFRRPEDLDESINTKRYEELYDDVYAKIIQVFQLNTKADLLTVDASAQIDQVSKTIFDYLKIYYNLQ
jgi:adenylate kinase family enzyme